MTAVASELSRMNLMRAANVALRGLSLGSKFVLLIAMAGFMSPSAIGEYGIFAATIGYALFILGLDFYTYSTREMLGSSAGSQRAILRNQAAFFVACYAAMLPVLYLILTRFDVLPRRMVGAFFVLLPLEHLAQELSRLLVVSGQPVAASLLGFLRSGSWVFASVALMAAVPAARNVETVIYAWGAGSLCSVLFGAACLRGLSPAGLRESVDWRWIWRGLCVCVPLLVATLAIRGLFVADRYFVQRYAGAEMLGVYTLFISIANAIQSFLDAAVHSFQYPRVVKAARSKDRTRFGHAVRSLNRATMGTAIALAGVAAASMPILLSCLHRPIYAAHIGMFFWILAGTALFAMSMVPHYALYAVGRDRAIVAANLACAILFLVAVPFLEHRFTTLGVPLALTLACAVMYALKLALLRCCGTGTSILHLS